MFYPYTGTPYKYIDSEGRMTIVAPYEHVIIITGYTKNEIQFTSEGSFYVAPTQMFLKSWGVLGNMVVLHQ